MNAFADLARLANREMQALLREVDQKDLVVALMGAEEELKTKFLSNMSQRMRTFITEEMEFLGAMPAGEIEEVRQRIVQQAVQLSEKGQLVWPPSASLKTEDHTKPERVQPAPPTPGSETILSGSKNMAPIIGALIVVCSVVVGYLAIGGNPDVLCQPAVFLIVAGSAVGALLMAGGVKGIAGILKALSSLLRTPPYNKNRYTDALGLMHEIFTTTRREGVLVLEQHVENPQTSSLFLAVPSVSADHRAVEFITDLLRLVIGGNFDAMQLEMLMDTEIAAHREAAELPALTLAKAADSLPAFGVVAAVMGVVVTMGALNGPPEVLGQHIGAALVGALLGVVLAYGFVGPLSSLLERRAQESTKFLEVIKVCLVASLNGYDPPTSVEFGRKVLYDDDRPTFKELENHLRQKKG